MRRNIRTNWKEAWYKYASYFPLRINAATVSVIALVQFQQQISKAPLGGDEAAPRDQVPRPKRPGS
jgi:hypothetical protein